MLTSLQAVLEAAKAKGGSKTIAVAAAHDPEVLTAVRDACAIGIAEVILVGDEAAIRKGAAEVEFDLTDVRVVDADTPALAARKAVELVRKGEAQMVMKGLLGTADILRAVLDKEIGLRTGRILSHVAIMEPLGFGRLVLLTDAAMNIAPDLKQKVQIIENALQVANSLGIECPKVAPVAAVEQVNADMPATLEAALLAKMADRGQIKGCLVDGPLAVDGAVSPAAAEHKGIKGPVAGYADILLAPDIEAGNAIYKTLVYLGQGKIAGVIAGAKAPIILTSRSDSPEAKLHSIAAAVLMAE